MGKVNILCALFGHTAKQYKYGRLVRETVDGIGREHACLEVECDRCGKVWRPFMTHLIPTTNELNGLAKAAEEGESWRVTALVLEAKLKTLIGQKQGFYGTYDADADVYRPCHTPHADCVPEGMKFYYDVPVDVPNEVVVRLLEQAVTQNDGGGAKGWCRVNYGDLLTLLTAVDEAPAKTIKKWDDKWPTID